MAVKFNESSFTIVVETVRCPIENWLETQEELIDMLQSEDDQMHTKHYHYLELLKSMQPDIETAKKMML